MALNNDARIRAAFHVGRARKLLRNIAAVVPDADRTAAAFDAAICELENAADALGNVAPIIGRLMRGEDRVPGGNGAFKT